MKAIIMAGGRGKRLAPYTTVIPKPLLPVGDTPILEIVLRQLKSCGIQEFVICVGYLGALLEAYFGKGEKWDVKISYVYEESPLGTAGPLASIPNLNDSFLVMNGDILSTIDYKKMIEFHKKHGQLATIGVAQKDVKIDLGVLDIAADKTLAAYTEKPTLHYSVSMGVYIFQPGIKEFIAPSKKMDMPDLIVKLKNEGKKVFAFESDCKWLDMGTPDDYATAVEAFDRDRSLYLKDGK